MSRLISGLVASVLAAAPAIVLLLAPSSASAVPAWSRKYQMACTVCHFGGTNKLTPFGRDFLWRGQRMQGSGDEEMSDGDFKMADYMSFASKVRLMSDKDASPSTEFDVEALSIYSGGPVDKNFSYFFEFYLHERGKESNSGGTGTVDTATREKLAEAYLFYNSDPDADTYWFARAGSWTPRVIHTASTGGRLSVSRPSILNDNAGGNLYTPRDRFYGATVGFVSKGKVFSEFGVTNGGGGNARPNQPENNQPKDFFGSVETVLDDEGSTLGFYAYSGEYPVTTPTAFSDKFTRYGFVGALNRENHVLSGGYFFGENDLSGGGNRQPSGYFIEGGINSNPETTWFGRYDYTDFDLGTTKKGFTVGVSRRLSNVGRFVVEVSDMKVSGSSNTQKLTFELNWLF